MSWQLAAVVIYAVANLLVGVYYAAQRKTTTVTPGAVLIQALWYAFVVWVVVSA